MILAGLGRGSFRSAHFTGTCFSLFPFEFLGSNPCTPPQSKSPFTTGAIISFDSGRNSPQRTATGLNFPIWTSLSSSSRSLLLSDPIEVGGEIPGSYIPTPLIVLLFPSISFDFWVFSDKSLNLFFLGLQSIVWPPIRVATTTTICLVQLFQFSGMAALICLISEHFTLFSNWFCAKT